jgi:YnbE-like lipoprotein
LHSLDEGLPHLEFMRGSQRFWHKWHSVALVRFPALQCIGGFSSMPIRVRRRQGAHTVVLVVRAARQRNEAMGRLLFMSSAILSIAACTPTVRVEVPDKPIEINLNINMKIEQNVRVKLERELDRAAQANPGIF